MKTYTTLIIILLFATVGFSQNIAWEKDYPTAMNKAQSENKALVIYFNDGNNSAKESIIKKEIFKSKTFKYFAKNAVGLLIESSQNSVQHKFNSRVVSGYNAYKVFPAIKVIDLKQNINLPLLKEFDNTTIDLFLNQLKEIIK